MADTPRGKRGGAYTPSQIPTKIDEGFLAWLKRELSNIASLGGSTVDSTGLIKVGDNVNLLGSGTATNNQVPTADGSGHVIWKDPTGGTSGTAWGSITGDIHTQLDLTPANIGAATSAQGAKADSALQPGAEVTSLTSGPTGAIKQVLTADGNNGVYWREITAVIDGVSLPFYLHTLTLDPIACIKDAQDKFFLPFIDTNGNTHNIGLI